MATEYSRSILKVVVAQICQTVGWHSINSTPLEFLVDLMQEYLLRISRLTHQYAEVLGRTDPNLDDIGLSFQHMNIDVQELIEYVKNVDSVSCTAQVPKFPVRRENHLNFLKPGSREVVTRPVHVHEHLPAMYPDTEEEYVSDKNENLMNGTIDLTSSSSTSSGNSNNTSPHTTSSQVVFKRPGDPVSFENPIVKRAKILEEGRPLREISSVIMTTSGFLSTAREGKLPEARTPHQVRSESPQPSSYPMVPPEVKCDKKPKKIVKKNLEDRKLDKENKKKKSIKELFKPDKIDESKIKKLVGMKELAKLKPLKPGGGKTQSTTFQELTGSRPSTPKIASPKIASPKATTSSPKLLKTPQSKVKADKIVDLTDNSPVIDKKEETVVKLPSEPDKQKLNIFKKISKPREEKDKDKETLEPHKYKDSLDSRENSPELIIDMENIEKPVHRNDVDTKGGREEKKITLTSDIQPGTQHYKDLSEELHTPSSNVYTFDESISPPVTPGTVPKTPDAPITQKRKKKEKSGKKKEPKLKSPKQCISPKKAKLLNNAELDTVDRPKTPQAPEAPLAPPILPSSFPYPLFPFPSAPGLIPPILSRFSLSLGRSGPASLPTMPNVALSSRFLNPPAKTEEYMKISKIKPMEREKEPLVPSSVELMTSLVPIESEKISEKEKIDDKLTKVFKSNKELSFMKVPEKISPTDVAPPIMSAPVAPIVISAPTVPVAQTSSKYPKAEKTEKSDMKSKEHKKEKKDKLKKKKDKKEKHKEKGEKVKEKKEKAEKREKLEKLKEKKEKKEKKKEKDSNKKNVKEDKNPEAVPKITLKLGTASPRPATPENTPMKKITIKPLVKKDEEPKREPSPELAKISALVTRPPKQKSASKKSEEGILDGSPALSTDSFSTNLTSVPLVSTPRAKKSNFQNLSQSELIPPSHFDSPSKLPNPLVPPQQPPYYFHERSVRNITDGFNGTEVKADPVPKKDDAKEDKENGRNMLSTTPTTTVDRGGRQVWICPACGNQDDGSPMIGCDDCDAWYHWVCVGMQVPPADDEDWYCRFCIAKKQELLHDKKKKKRKKKMKITA